MDGINLNTGANAVTWESLLSKLGEVEKTTTPEGKEALTLTTKVGGEAKTYTISIPADLELPKTVDAAVLDSLVGKLKAAGFDMTAEQISAFKDAVTQAYDAAAKALAEVKGNPSKKGVMFDLYALMALLVEVAQKQRDATREMRLAEMSAIQKSIQNQADEQKNAALTGLIIGVVCGAAAAIASAGMMIGQSVYASKQANVAGQEGTTDLGIRAKMLKMTDTEGHASQQLETVKGKVGADVANDVTAEFEGLVNEGDVGPKFTKAQAQLECARDLKAAKQALEAKEADVGVKQKELDEAQAAEVAWSEDPNQLGELPQEITERLDTAQVELGKAQAEVETAKAKVTEAEQKLATASEGKFAVPKAMEDVDKLITDKTAEFATARDNYVEVVKGAAGDIAGRYKSAVQARMNAPKTATKAEIKAMDKTVAKAEAEMKMAHALEANALGKKGVLEPAERQRMVTAAVGERDLAVQRMSENMDYKSAASTIQALAGINGIVMALGGTMQAVAQNSVALEQSKAIRASALQQKENEQLDQTKDLFAQNQKLIDAVVQLMNAVRQAETQSMRDAIQA